MRRTSMGLALAAVLPLAGCFDADVTADFTDTSAVRLDAVMTMDPEVYDLTQGMGEDPCEDGEGSVNPDGSFTCTMGDTRTLDDLLAAMDDPENDLGIGEGVEIRELDNGNISVSFDLSEMTEDLPPEEERQQVAAMFGDALAGHAMTLTVIGDQIVSTNGEILGDGTAARLVIPLTVMFDPVLAAELPQSFDTELVPGG